MIEYLIPQNIDDRILRRAKDILLSGGLIAYPTDTSWGIGASAASKTGIEKLRRLKGDFHNFTLTLICSSISEINQVAEIGNFHFKIIKKYTPGPFVFILKAKHDIEKKINMKRVEIGVRIPSNPVPIGLIQTLGHPIFSITASKKMTNREWWDEKYAEENLFECGWELENIPEIDLILDHGEALPKALSTVIDMTEENIEIKREGTGNIR